MVAKKHFIDYRLCREFINKVLSNVYMEFFHQLGIDTFVKKFQREKLITEGPQK